MGELDVWIVAFVGGLVGSYCMDITESNMANNGIASGVKGEHIGRWVHGIFKGKFYHSDIDEYPTLKNELLVATIFHYLVGGGVVALAYLIMLMSFNVAGGVLHIPLSLLFGLLTCVLPWLILMPMTGKGLFGVGMPGNAKPILAPIVSHIAYGSGIGATFIVYELILAI